MKKKTVEKILDTKIQASAKEHPETDKLTKQQIRQKAIRNIAYAKAMVAVFNYYEYEDDIEKLEKILFLKLDDDPVSDIDKELIEENQDFFDNPDIFERVELIAKMLLSLKDMESCEVGRCIRSFKSDKNKIRFNEWLEKLGKRGLKNLPKPFNI